MRIGGARSSPSTNDGRANNIPKDIATTSCSLSARTNSHSTNDYGDDPSTYSKSTFGTATYSAAKSQNGMSSSSVISRGNQATEPSQGVAIGTQQPSSWVNQVKNRFGLLVDSSKSPSSAAAQHRTPRFSATKSTDFQEILNTSAITDHDNDIYPNNTINCSSPQEFVSGAFTIFRAGIYDFMEYGDKICQSTNQKNNGMNIPNVVGPNNNSSSTSIRRDSQKTIKTMNIDTNSMKLPTEVVDNTPHPLSPTDVQVDISNYTATGGDDKQQDLSIEMDKMLKMLWEKEAKGIGPTLAELNKCEQMYAQLAKETSNNNNSKEAKNNKSTDEISDIIDQHEKEADSLHLIDDKEDTSKVDNDNVYVNSANKLMQLMKKKDTNMNNISTVMKNLDESNITMDSSVIGTRLVPSFSVDLEEEDNDIATDTKNAAVNKKNKEVPKASAAIRAVSDPLFSLALDGKDDLVVDFEQSLTTSQVNADQMNTTQKVSNATTTAEVKIIENVVDDLASDFTPNVSISSQAETSVCHNKTPIKLKAPPRGNNSGRNNKIMRKMFSDGVMKYKPKSTASVKKIKGTNEYVIPLKGDKDDEKKKSSTTVDLDFSADFASDFHSTLPSSGKLDCKFPVSTATDTQVLTLTETRVCAWCKKGGKTNEEFTKTLKLCSACKTTYYCR